MIRNGARLFFLPRDESIRAPLPPPWLWAALPLRFRPVPKPAKTMSGTVRVRPGVLVNHRRLHRLSGFLPGLANRFAQPRCQSGQCLPGERALRACDRGLQQDHQARSQKTRPTNISYRGRGATRNTRLPISQPRLRLILNATVFANRAAAYLAVNQFYKAIEDLIRPSRWIRNSPPPRSREAIGTAPKLTMIALSPTTRWRSGSIRRMRSPPATGASPTGRQ